MTISLTYKVRLGDTKVDRSLAMKAEANVGGVDRYETSLTKKVRLANTHGGGGSSRHN